MLYLLYEWLKDADHAKYLNFLRYPTFRIVAAATSSLLIGMLVGPRLIERLRISQHGQSNVREDTPESHQKKKGTPTLGGTLILLSHLPRHVALRRSAQPRGVGRAARPRALASPASSTTTSS